MLSCAIFALVASGCGRGGPQRADAGQQVDAGDDAGAPDSGSKDAGAVDAGPADAGAADAGVTDGGAEDAGAADAGAIDAGAPDAGPLAFFGVHASPLVAGEGTVVRVSASVSRALASEPPPVLTVAGRAATLVAGEGESQLIFEFVPSAALDPRGDALLQFNATAADGTPGQAAVGGALRLAFDGQGASVPDAGPDVLTRSNGPARTGATLVEAVLSPATVSPDTFGKLGTLVVDGQVYAQPLYAAGAPLADGGAADVLYVATEHGSVYAFDADRPDAGAPYWQVDAGAPMPSTDLWAGCVDLVPEIGITATPVIDRSAGLLYVLAKSKAAGQVNLLLHALDLATGAERLGGPVEVAPPAALGVPFDPLLHQGRPGLLLWGGAVWLGLASHCDLTPYHGWVLAYDAATLAPRGAWTPEPAPGTEGGVWQSGQGFSADATGVYVVTGNGDADFATLFGDSVVRLGFAAAGGLALQDWFTPWNASQLQAQDNDLGTSGALLVPGSDFLVTAGKAGALYLLRRSLLGGAASADQQVPQKLLLPGSGAVFGALAHWRGPAGDLIYAWDTGDVLRAYWLDHATSTLVPAAVGTVGLPAWKGPSMSVSALGGRHRSGIVWAAHQFQDSDARGILRAFDAEDISRELWNSEADNARDAVGVAGKLSAPTVAAGRVYLGTFSGTVQVYGLLP